MALSSGIGGNAHDGMAFANEQALWVCPYLTARACLYRTRNPRATALYRLLEAYYEDVKSLWEERFEKKYGFWRGFVDQVVARYLDCGVAEAVYAVTD